MRITLANDLEPNRTPSILYLEYTAAGAVAPVSVQLTFAGAIPQGVGTLECTNNLNHHPQLRTAGSRTLVAHYPTPPNTVRIQVINVLP